MILPNIAAIGQRDTKWASKKLGTSTTTIGDAGCVLVSATIICRFYGKDIWPDWLNEQMVKVGGYADGNLWLWHKLTDIFPDIRVHDLIDCYTVPAPLDKIDQCLEQGHPVIVCVDFDPKPGIQTHFVVIFGKDERGYYIADPWHNDVALLHERYGDPAKAIYAIRMYDGPLTPTISPEVEELRKKVEELTKRVGTLEGANAELAKKLTEKDAQIGELKADVKKWQAEAKSANDNLGKVLEEKGTIERDLESAERKIERLEKELAEMEKEKNANWQLYKKALEGQADKLSATQLSRLLLERLFTIFTKR